MTNQTQWAPIYWFFERIKYIVPIEDPLLDSAAGSVPVCFSNGDQKINSSRFQAFRCYGTNVAKLNQNNEDDPCFSSVSKWANESPNVV